jgi:hypothetical protein
VFLCFSHIYCKGAQNTIDIETGCTTAVTAADICANLTLGEYSDWFLPSNDELNLMWQNIGQGNAFGPVYWSSTENDNLSAWRQGFSTGNQFTSAKDSSSLYVRSVRAF